MFPNSRKITLQVTKTLRFELQPLFDGKPCRSFCIQVTRPWTSFTLSGCGCNHSISLSSPTESFHLLALDRKAELSMMANATQIRLDAKAEMVCSVPNITAEAAQKASEILQENHDKNDIIFTDQGLHSK